MATENIHTGKYAATINQAISEAKALAVIVSEDAGASHDVEREVALAADRKVLILPLVYGEYRATGSLEYYLAGQQYIDCGQFDDAMKKVADAVRGAPRPKPRPKPLPRRNLDFLAALSAIFAVLSAVTPFPLESAARIVITAVLLVFPVIRALAWIRPWRPLRRAAALLILLLYCTWTLDRAALQSVIRRELTSTRAIFHAPYGNVQGLQQKVPPNMKCTVQLPEDANQYNPGGPESAVVVTAFGYPEIIEIACDKPFPASAVGSTAISEFEIWDYGIYRWIRWLFIAIGGLLWSGSLYVWRRSPPLP